MTISIIHISDIHFRDDSDPWTERADAIVAAVRSRTGTIENPILVCSGDVAFSGKASEYKIAKRFFDRLRELLPGARFIMTPGNHDCDLDSDNATRRTLIDSIRVGGEIDDSVILNCTTVQDNFFAFYEGYAPNGATIPGNRLVQVVDIHLGTRLLRFATYNTSWISKLTESQSIVLPLPLKRLSGNADIECIVTHHPHNWLRADNARVVRDHFESAADIIFTGHEHSAGNFVKLHDDGRGSNYCEAAALRDHSTCSSGFTLLSIDTEQMTKTAAVFEWDGDRYVTKHSGIPTVVRVKRPPGLEFSTSFLGELNDLGAPFTHSAKTRLRLRDLFVYPDIELQPSDHREDERAFIPGAEFVDYVANNGHMIVSAADEGGKTTLAKVLCTDFFLRGFRPLLLQGEMIKSTSTDGYRETAARVFAQQYDRNSSFEIYQALNPEQRVLIVDDVDCSRLNARGLDKFLTWAKEYFGKVICFASELFEFRPVAIGDDNHATFLEFKRCKIKELGYVLRGRIIEKWHALGREESITDEEFANRVDESEKAIDTVLAGNICPSHPVFILGILQTWEANQSVQTVSGSFGQVYEALIARALTARGQRIPSDAKYTILSMIAFHLYKSEKRWLDDTELAEVLRHYAQDFGLTVDMELLRKELCTGQMLCWNDGAYKFNHKYVFYYFTARYIRDFIADRGTDSGLNELVGSLASTVHEEDAANILIFLVYLTKSDLIIDAILATARQLFPEVAPCDLDEHIQFINEFTKVHTRENLSLRPVEESREELRRQRDAVAAASDRPRTERNEIIQLNRALKTVQILGQILRNFPGSLQSPRKIQLARETYDLGLRALNSVFRQFEQGWAEARDIVAEFLRGQKEFEDEQELEQSTNEFLFLLMRSFAHFFVKKISYAVGSEYLKTTYAQIVKDTPTVAVRLIDLSVKLDHFRPISSDYVHSVYKELYKNFLSSSILRRLIRDHLYLYPVSIQTKQSLCAKVNIAFDNVAFLNRGAKRLTR